ncbi:hypothetical protein [Ochrobactrum teleogrylli]|uniref:Uncharacterized protein n=1 Tax=Ochrobactrum teleogrylli TaxID=2479765 RepID=A0ABY2XY73_9HYPH|nr:hypothetical protein [[Ochrobactrum] teleogrylli]TNV09317.1 hypothetical protein FIC94_22155 [[Ochrobactrum] teleogrylli]
MTAERAVAHAAARAAAVARSRTSAARSPSAAPAPAVAPAQTVALAQTGQGPSVSNLRVAFVRAAGLACPCSAVSHAVANAEWAFRALKRIPIHVQRRRRDTRPLGGLLTRSGKMRASKRALNPVAIPSRIALPKGTPFVGMGADASRPKALRRSGSAFLNVFPPMAPRRLMTVRVFGATGPVQLSSRSAVAARRGCGPPQTTAPPPPARGGKGVRAGQRFHKRR